VPVPNRFPVYLRICDRRAALALVCLGFGGCGDDAGGDTTSAGGQGGAGGEAAGGASGTDTYTAGMKRAGVDQKLTVTLLDAVPAPPQRELNDWRLRVEDATGEAVTGCTVGVGLYMPVHGHSSTTEPVITPADTAGVVLYAKSDLSVGHHTITLAAADEMGERAVYTIGLDILDVPDAPTLTVVVEVDRIQVGHDGGSVYVWTNDRLLISEGRW
jgi:hypothetical protein